MHLSEQERSRLAGMGVQMGGAQHNYTTPEGQAYLDAVFTTGEYPWNHPDLARITILRLLSDRGFPMWDVSYCHGELKDGRPCRVQLPFDQLPKKRMMGAIVQYARQDKVYAKGLGIFDAISTLQ